MILQCRIVVKKNKSFLHNSLLRFFWRLKQIDFTQLMSLYILTVSNKLLFANSCSCFCWLFQTNWIWTTLLPTFVDCFKQIVKQQLVSKFFTTFKTNCFLPTRAHVLVDCLKQIAKQQLVVNFWLTSNKLLRNDNSSSRSLPLYKTNWIWTTRHLDSSDI